MEKIRLIIKGIWNFLKVPTYTLVPIYLVVFGNLGLNECNPTCYEANHVWIWGVSGLIILCAVIYFIYMILFSKNNILKVVGPTKTERRIKNHFSYALGQFCLQFAGMSIVSVIIVGVLRNQITNAIHYIVLFLVCVAYPLYIGVRILYYSTEEVEDSKERADMK